MKIIYYWCPYFSKIATEKSVINSIESLNKYSKDKYRPILINALGEWDWLKNKKNNIEFHDLTKFKIIKFLPKEGFLQSRFSYAIIFLLSFFPLLKLLKQTKDTYFIIHLITSLPIFLSLIFRLKTRIILRVSGLPKMNLLRKFFWRISGKKMFKIICPTTSTKKFLEMEKIFDQKKIHFVRDPVFSISKINLYKKEKINLKNVESKDLLIAIGRLTKQKNFDFLVDCFNKIEKKFPKIFLVILGNGEMQKDLNNKIKIYGLTEKIKLLGFKENIFPYLKKSKFFILSSLWEDPGFVLIEAAASNTSIISSDCINGPKDFIKNDLNGFSFKSNNEESFAETFKNAYFCNKDIIFKKKVKAKKEAKLYTSFNHFTELVKIF